MDPFLARTEVIDAWNARIEDAAAGIVRGAPDAEEVARSSPARVLLLLALASGLSGCVSAMELGRAETLRRGAWEVDAAVGGWGFTARKTVPATEATGGMVVFFPLLPVDLTVSYGVTDRLQLDGRVGTASAQLGMMAGLLRSPALSLAAAGRLSADGYARGIDGGAIATRLALVAGTRIVRNLELDLAPQISWSLRSSGSRPLLLGATGTVRLQGPEGRRSIGVAASWQRYHAPSPRPGDVREADYVGLALVFSSRGAGEPR